MADILKTVTTLIAVILLIHPPIDIGGSLNETTAFHESWQNTNVVPFAEYISCCFVQFGYNLI
ncbi:MAG: hypothetical protein ACRCUY_04490 [Thermoguttaceae bacterium]